MEEIKKHHIALILVAVVILVIGYCANIIYDTKKISGMTKTIILMEDKLNRVEVMMNEKQICLGERISQIENAVNENIADVENKINKVEMLANKRHVDIDKQLKDKAKLDLKQIYDELGRIFITKVSFRTELSTVKYRIKQLESFEKDIVAQQELDAIRTANKYDLKPCPKCQKLNTGRFVSTETYPTWLATSMFVQCSECGYKGFKYKYDNLTEEGVMQGKRNAKSLWDSDYGAYMQHLEYLKEEKNKAEK